MRVLEYLAEDGKSPFGIWFENLDSQVKKNRRVTMPLTKEFKDTVMARVRQDPEFRSELLVEATNAFLDDDVETGKALLRDYLNATELLPKIASELDLNEKSVRRMLGPSGNPTLKNFARLLKACSEIEHLKLRVCPH